MSGDVTGRDRLAKNVSASYLSHIVFIIFGFLLPRMISDRVGQAGLGLWDFSWAFVKYMNLSMIGIGSSVNRYVAQYRTAGDTLGLNRTISTVVAIQCAIAFGVLIATIILAWVIPFAFGERLGEDGHTARWVVAFLGSSLVIQMAFDAWRGVLTGCHRWDYYNGLNAGSYAIISIGMVLALLAGYGLIEIAFIYMVGTLLTELIRYWLARKVCPELNLSRKLINRADALKVVKFGSKTILLGMPAVISQHTVNIFMVAKLGPAALAVLARPAALISTVRTLIGKFTNVLVPTAGSLQKKGSRAELRAFALENSRINLILAIPPLAFLLILGDIVVELWMGPNYANLTISVIFAAAVMLPMSQSAMMKILTGMDLHGRVAKRSAIMTVILLGIGIAIASYVGWSLPVAAALSSIPPGISIATNVLHQSFKHLNIGFSEYFTKVLRDGLILLFTNCTALYALRYYFTDLHSWGILLAGMSIVGLVMIILHHRDMLQFYRAIRK